MEKLKKLINENKRIYNNKVFKLLLLGIYMPTTLPDFLNEKTHMEPRSLGDGLASYRTDIEFSHVTESVAQQLRDGVSEFYIEHGYVADDNGPEHEGLVFRKGDDHSKAVAFSYFRDTNEVIISSVTVGRGGISG